MKHIYYLGTYRTEYIAERKPLGSSAEDYKMSYIISVLKRLNYSVTVISMLSGSLKGWHPRKICNIDAFEKHIYLESYDTSSKWFSKLGSLLRLVAVFNYLFLNLNKNDILLVYHMQLLSVPVRLAKKIKRFKVILEVEEIFYKDERNPRDIKRKKLEQALLNTPDAYIVASDLLQKLITSGKKSAVIYGGLLVPPKYVERFFDGNIHIIYAGGIDELRRVDLAIDSFRYLGSNYKFHILGFGSPDTISKMIDQINTINNEFREERIRFYGRKSGIEYDKLLQSCHIGLNMQCIGTSIETVAFPSKITSYLGRGLNVVSSQLKSIENSKINRCVYYYTENDPQSIATAINKVKINTYEDQVEIIYELDALFVKDMQSIIESIRV
jgi:glycosyltransferase involved in cell wall biosynthesis